MLWHSELPARILQLKAALVLLVAALDMVSCPTNYRLSLIVACNYAIVERFINYNLGSNRDVGASKDREMKLAPLLTELIFQSLFGTQFRTVRRNP
ncbi:MAG: hypothetical protein ABR555_06195 [Pyrinomonadaceae bacterium]